MTRPIDPERLYATTRPDPALMKVYVIHAIGRAAALLGVLGLVLFRFVDLSAARKALAGLPGNAGLWLVLTAYALAYLAVVAALYVRYATLRYRFDEHGVGQSWGLFFRRETFVAYGRIQDIQISRSVFEKAFGLGTIEIQTASGGGGAEATLDGLREFEGVAEYLRDRLRGRRASPAVDPLAVLDEVRDAVRDLREAVAARRRA